MLQSTLLLLRFVVHASWVVLVLDSRSTCFQKTNNVVCVFRVHATLGFRAFYINELDVFVVLSPLVLALCTCVCMSVCQAARDMFVFVLFFKVSH